MAGVTADGFEIKTFEQIKEELGNSFKITFGDHFDVTTESPDGQLIEIFADALANQWALAEESYNSFVPSKSYGSGLDNLAEIVNIPRVEGTLSLVYVELVGVASTVVPSGSSLVNQDGDIFETVDEVILPGSTNVVSRNYGTFDVSSSAVFTPVTQITGWTAVTNADDGFVEEVKETDQDFRTRISASTITRGTSTINAIYSALAARNTNKVRIVENVTGSALESGQPNNSIRVIATGPESTIVEEIFNNITLGVPSWGSQSGVVSDVGGHPHTVYYDTPTLVDTYINVNIVLTDASPTFEADITSKLMEYVDNRNIGSDVIWSDLFMALSGQLGIAIPLLQVGASGATASSDFVIADDEQAVITADKISITVV